MNPGNAGIFLQAILYALNRLIEKASYGANGLADRDFWCEWPETINAS